MIKKLWWWLSWWFWRQWGRCWLNGCEYWCLHWIHLLVTGTAPLYLFTQTHCSSPSSWWWWWWWIFKIGWWWNQCNPMKMSLGCFFSLWGWKICWHIKKIMFFLCEKISKPIFRCWSHLVGASWCSCRFPPEIRALPSWDCKLCNIAHKTSIYTLGPWAAEITTKH